MPHVFSNKAFLGPLLTYMYLLWSIKLSIYLAPDQRSYCVLQRSPAIFHLLGERWVKVKDATWIEWGRFGNARGGGELAGFPLSIVRPSAFSSRFPLTSNDRPPSRTPTGRFPKNVANFLLRSERQTNFIQKVVVWQDARRACSQVVKMAHQWSCRSHDQEVKYNDTLPWTRYHTVNLVPLTLLTPSTTVVVLIHFINRLNQALRTKCVFTNLTVTQAG